MRKPRTLRQLYEIEGWLSRRECSNADSYDNKRTVITLDNLRSAFDFEKSLLADLKFNFPRKGECYKTLRNVPANSLMTFNGPYSCDERVIIPKGVCVKIEWLSSIEEPVFVYASPIDKAGMENILVPQDSREDPKYNGYLLFIMTTEFEDGFCRS